MKNMRLFMAVILCLICTALMTGVVVSADKIEKTNEVIAEDHYKSVSLAGLPEGEEIDVSVTVSSPSGALIDVYILSSNDYILNYPDDTFSPALSRERVTSTDFTFTRPDDQIYYLVIDNENNSRPNDAVPVGSVTVDYEYDDPLGGFMKAAETIAWTCVAAIAIVVIVIIVIIVVVVYIVVKKGKPPQPQYPPQPPYQQPYQQPPYQQYPQQPQQPYQPPPQQPPGQPPPGQPPPGQ